MRHGNSFASRKASARTAFSMLAASCLIIASCGKTLPDKYFKAAVEAGYVHASGKEIHDALGKPLYLNGFGLGGWLVPEGYMIRSYAEAYDAPSEIETGIIDVAGREVAEEFFKAYRENYVSEADIRKIASWGCNSLRIPFTWKLLMDETDLVAPYTYKESGFEILDWAIDRSNENGMYAILDMHCAPGAQSPYNIADAEGEGEARLWTMPDTYQPMCVDLWRKIAARYADRKSLIGYDLLNEPKGDAASDEGLRSLYVRITEAIRAADPCHMIFIEGGRWAQDFNALVPPWDGNMVYAFHSYPPVSTLAWAKPFLTLRETYGVPVWLGETGENRASVYAAASSFLKRNDIGVSWWTHKKILNDTCPLSAPLVPGFQAILDYWAGKGPKPSPEAAKAALMAQAEALKLERCALNLGVLESLGMK
jgi:endoglucanase